MLWKKRLFWVKRWKRIWLIEPMQKYVRLHFSSRFSFKKEKKSWKICWLMFTSLMGICKSEIFFMNKISAPCIIRYIIRVWSSTYYSLWSTLKTWGIFLRKILASICFRGRQSYWFAIFGFFWHKIGMVQSFLIPNTSNLENK